MTTYYVGSGGNDGNAGTSWALRKATLNGAEDIPVAAGDTVYAGPGVYRELLTCDVSGAAGSLITYIGDYDGSHTDGVGGVVRITGSDDDATATRNYAINVGARTHRVFRGFLLDSTASHLVTGSTSTDTTLEQCVLGQGGTPVYLDGASHARWTIRNCMFGPQAYNLNAVVMRNGAAVDNSGHVIENCVIIGPANTSGIYSVRVGGITIRNTLIMCAGIGVQIGAALTAGQTVTVNNCIIRNCTTGLSATVLGEITEDYNCLSQCNTPRTNTGVGAHSNTYFVQPDTRWFFEMVGGGSMVTPFDLASYSQLLNVAGTAPTATDMRGTGTIGAQREWGALEYDSTLDIEAGTGGGGSSAVSISPWRGGMIG